MILEIAYLDGFGAEHATEALPGALPVDHPAPQASPYGLYAEQLSGSAFPSPDGRALGSWLYRLRPAAVHSQFRPDEVGHLEARFMEVGTPPDPLRWDPRPIPRSATDFVDGLYTLAGNGRADQQAGCRMHVYGCNRSMERRYFYDADGELLIVPQDGELLLETELGRLHVQPHEVALVPRGVRFRVRLPEGKPARGYVCENFGTPLGLPAVAGGADPAHFQFPVAWYEDVEGRCELVCKFLNRTWSAQMMHSPLDVVAWRGNYAPYKYDLRRFHPAEEGARAASLPPVLASPGGGGDALQFVVFPPRWSVAEHAFPAPWYHRNVASEFMGLVAGAYEARAGGFVPGGSSLHNCMIGHGPDAAAWERLRSAAAGHVPSGAPAEPALAFMFETRMPLRSEEHTSELQSH